MNCPRCNSKAKKVDASYQSQKFKCPRCGLVSNPKDYEWEYELYHPGFCGRCKQQVEK